MLSIALIVKNEQKNLTRCLNSIKGLGDELVIVDTGSSDNTVEIAKQYTSQVYFFEWIKDFAAARNFSFSKCTQPWVMWIDADDVLHPEDVEIINNQLSKVENQVDYVLMNYHYFLSPEGKPLATQLRERIIRRSVARWEGRCHEIIPVNFNKSTFFESCVWHMRDHQDRVADSNRNIELMELEVQERPSHRSYHYLAQEYGDHGQHEKAVKAYLSAYSVANNVDDKFQIAFKLARSQMALQRDDEAVEWFLKTISHHASYREPCLDLAKIYLSKKDYHKAIFWIEAALKLSEPKHPTLIIQKDYYTWLPYDMLAKSYFAVGEYKKAVNACEELYDLTKTESIKNDILVIKEAEKKTFKRPTGIVKLNLGAGGKPEKGYTNCDLFPGPGIDEVFSLDEVPYADNSVDEIASEHALEHLPRIKAEAALKEWARILKPGGKLDLKIPDLELCCQSFLSDIPNRYTWYLHTIFGIQDWRHEKEKLQNSVNYGQIHYTGFTKDRIKELLNQNGLIVKSIVNYSGWGTPSIHVIAHKISASNSIGILTSSELDTRMTKSFNKECINFKVSDVVEDLEFFDVLLVASFKEEYLNCLSKVKLFKHILILSNQNFSILNYDLQQKFLSLCDFLIIDSSSQIVNSSFSKIFKITYD